MARAIRRGTPSTTQVDAEVESQRSLQPDGNADDRAQDGEESAPGGQRAADLMHDRFDEHSADDGWTDSTDAFDGSVSDDERRSMIAEAAYLIAQRRGFDGGLELEDWLAAEAEVEARLASG
jgi:hypothetical protein